MAPRRRFSEVKEPRQPRDQDTRDGGGRGNEYRSAVRRDFEGDSGRFRDREWGRDRVDGRPSHHRDRDWRRDNDNKDWDRGHRRDFPAVDRDRNDGKKPSAPSWADGTIKASAPSWADGTIKGSAFAKPSVPLVAIGDSQDSNKAKEPDSGKQAAESSENKKDSTSSRGKDVVGFNTPSKPKGTVESDSESDGQGGAHPQAVDNSTPLSAEARAFKNAIAKIVIKKLGKYYKRGQIGTKDDFKHLSRKMAGACLRKEKGNTKVDGTTETKVKKYILNYFNKHKKYTREGREVTAKRENA